jgi:hypothetical protein
MPQDQTAQPIDPAKLSAINQLILLLSQLLSALLNAGRATADTQKLVQINNEYSAVQTCLDQTTQAQAASDGAVFQQATSALKVQAAMLDEMEKKINVIVDDAALAGRIVGYITQAITIIAKL